MGKSSAKKSNQCAVCHHSFGITRWRHTCSLCQRNVCDDCAPMSANIVNNGETTIANIDSNDNTDISNINSSGSRENVVNVRICKNCKVYSSNSNNNSREQTSNQLNMSNKANIDRVQADRTCSVAEKSNQASLPVTMQRANPNDPAERERRAQVAEARLRAEQTRGIAIHNDKIGTRQSNTQISQAEYHGKSDNNNNNDNTINDNGRTSAKSEENSVKSGEARRVGGTSPPAGSNPVLEAALRRQRQSTLPCNNAAAAQFSAEKTKLLREIDNLLARHAGTAPFGLRSSDESKLRIYLNYLKEKYNSTA